MKRYIFGTKGFAKEVEYMLTELYPKNSIEIIFVAEDSSEDVGTRINGREVISEYNFNSCNDQMMCYIAVGNPAVRLKIYNKLKNKTNISFPNLIHRNAQYDKRYVNYGIGNIICSGVSMTTNIKIGNFVHINLNSTVGHDTIIEDFVTVSPSVNVSGNVVLQNCVYLGTNSTIIEKINICKDIIIGAGCVVVKSLTQQGTYVGIPAKKMEK